MKKTLSYLIFFCLVITLLPGCAIRQDFGKRLDSIESYISNDPQRALDSLRAMSQKSITGAGNCARHALLHSMALDKNYIDITSDSIIAPALRWYRHHGTADQKLKTHYYMGRICQNRGDRESAMEHFMEAERSVPSASDAVAKGLLYMGKAKIFGEIYDFEAIIENAEKAGDFYMEAKDTNKYISTLCTIANKYLILEQYDSCRSALDEIKRFWDNTVPSKKSNYFHTLISLQQKEGAIDSSLETVEKYIENMYPGRQWPECSIPPETIGRKPLTHWPTVPCSLLTMKTIRLTTAHCRTHAMLQGNIRKRSRQREDTTTLSMHQVLTSSMTIRMPPSSV